MFAATYFAHKSNKDALALVMPSDHHSPDNKAFIDMVQSGCPAAMNGASVVFGVRPNKPETGYGYIELGKSALTGLAMSKSFMKNQLLISQRRCLLLVIMFGTLKFFSVGYQHLWISLNSLSPICLLLLECQLMKLSKIIVFGTWTQISGIKLKDSLLITLS